MKNITYVGQSDIRQLSIEALKAVGVESKEDLEFHKGIPQELNNELGDTLLNNPAFATEFEEANEQNTIVEGGNPDQTELPINTESPELKRSKSK